MTFVFGRVCKSQLRLYVRLVTRHTCSSLHGEPDEAFPAAHKHALLAVACPQKDAGHTLAQDTLIDEHICQVC